jgi:chromosome segregation protein
MLKALELAGFKSFAEKTRFEFHSGITVVVGPNGSGKSNVVDAIKWVLGEQSVKSLRGKEMADVIFNGSASRPALNACEATLTFDNSRRLLAVDTDEVHVTRRVYRSGEGEYLINRQPSRLRDIRELFSGTGVATEAYSVIEQGKVDVMLQASPKDRRAIFEEAAGISRFKAKKVESLRRLERVEQNLLRLSDIVAEVESRLRSVRLQAAKARRHKEHTDRLQALRTQVGLADWRHLSERLVALEAEARSLDEDLVATSASIATQETEAFALDVTLADAHEGIRAAESRLAQNRERIAVHESSIEQGRARLREIEDDLARRSQQLAQINQRTADLHDQLAETRTELATAEAEHAELAAQLTEDQRQADEAARDARTSREETERLRLQYLDRMRQGAAIGNQISGIASQLDGLRAAQQRRETQQNELRAERDTLTVELEALRRTLEERLAAVEAARTAAELAEKSVAELRARRAEQQSQLHAIETQHAAMSERAGVLAELESRLEGLTSAAKEVLIRARAASGGPLSRIRGLLADQFAVSLDFAPAIEAALGELSGYLLVDPNEEFFEYLARADAQFAGRVGFLRVDQSHDAQELSAPFADDPAILGRADQLLEVSAEYAPLLRRLLRRTWVVRELADALRLAEAHPGEWEFATITRDLVSANGSLTLGARKGATGIVSRRSELRALAKQLATLHENIAQQRQELLATDETIKRAESAARESQQALGGAQSALGEHRTGVQSAQERVLQLERQAGVVERELAAAVKQVATGETELSTARQRMAEIETDLAEKEAGIAKRNADRESLEETRRVHEQRLTGVKVDLAKSDERRRSLQGRVAQFELDHDERHKSLDEQHRQIAAGRQRLEQVSRGILSAESEVAGLYLRKEEFSGEIVRLLNETDAHRRRRAELLASIQESRNAQRQLEERIHKRRLSVGELQLERGAIEGRLRDDYGLEISHLSETIAHQPVEEREAIDREIADLRRKIHSIGAVNLAALDELEELERRHEHLAGQFNDLTEAKNSLEQIIQRINADSRRLFAETLETVRTNFQALFRKLFGGGHADIVLEEGVDILESGVEIVARPPGTRPAYIGQLSGGQRALTCVALLMAIFQFRPSPFCVLDEVDAPLDEANIERFVTVLKEFLAWTQFIVVTHSKKTMTCASTLYGVTMQESGVSKRVSVRFQDVSEDGQILRPAGDDETAAA